MNPLEELLQKIEHEQWDAKDHDLINTSFQELNGRLYQAGDYDLLALSEKEREAFAFTKTTEGLKWKLAGTRTLEDGTEEPLEWPDIKAWKEADFQYIYQRFKTTQNTFARSEYGLILYFTGRLKPDECKQLYQDLIELSKRYYEITKQPGKVPFHATQFLHCLQLALKIAHYKRKAPGFSNELENALLLAEQMHKEWKQAGKYLLRNIVDITAIILQYFSFAKPILNLDGFFDRNNAAVEEEAKAYTWGGIYIIDENIKLGKAIDKDVTALVKRKAQLYENLATERRPGDLAIITFVETALRLYEEIGDTDNIPRLEQEFKKVKAEGEYGMVSSELMEEESGRIEQIIKEEVATKNETQILETFVHCPMFSTLENVQLMADKQKNEDGLFSMMGSSISDKFGNTIAKYPNNSEEWAFLQAYEFQFQLGTQSLVYFFRDAFMAGKISEISINTFLQNTWFNDPIKRIYNNQAVAVVPLELVKPAIRYFLAELNRWKNEPGYIPDLILVTDSLTLKIEALLRYMCDKLRISTFKLRDDDLVMERNLDEILASLEHEKYNTNFQEDDRRFIKFVLSEKAGENLRNKVAHGLMDSFEYSFDKIILVFTIMMRLTKYTFQTVNNG
ncbi:MAG: DUF4209 domain-containing protein [Williamsia sp.]|nr:DUF4209 domain-containing protein [Williamsia sp.]